MSRTWRRAFALAALGTALCGPVATVRAQVDSGQPRGNLFERPDLGPLPGVMEPNLPPSPGALAPNPFALDPGIIGGRRRGVGRIPRPGRRPTLAAPAPGLGGLSLPLLLAPSGPPPATPTRMPLALDATIAAIDEGDPGGLTLDEAIARLMADNLDLLALRYEIPQADADILTASLRANPLLYMDTQFIPYGSFTNKRPGGPTQYDVNVTYPIDLSHKRQARVKVARAAKRVIEAQYQDVVRRQIGNLGKAFVDLQAARISYLSAQRTIQEQERVIAQRQRTPGAKATALDLERLNEQLDKTRAGLAEVRDALSDAQEALALLLNLPPEQVGRLAPRGRLRVPDSPVPPGDALIQTALQNRPDLAAARLGLIRAENEIPLARKNVLDDAYLFYDPITYQDNRPSKLNSSRSWDVGVTVPLPIHNRNQGNIARAHGNRDQTYLELAALQRRIVSEVRQANREYQSAREALERFERSTLPHARSAGEKATTDFANGKIDSDVYLGQLDDKAETARLYRDSLVRYRRSMLDLNTSVGMRLLP